MRGALPTCAVIGARIQTVSPICKICSKGNETIQHMLFQCDGARAIWIGSNLGIRSDELRGDVREIITSALQNLDLHQVCSFTSTMCEMMWLWEEKTIQ